MAGAQTIFIATGAYVYCRSEALAADIERLNYIVGGSDVTDVDECRVRCGFQIPKNSR